MRNISPYNFFAFVNGAVPSIMRYCNNNSLESSIMSYAFLAPATVFAEDDYFNEMITSYSISEISYFAKQLYYGNTDKALNSLAQGVFVPLVAWSFRRMFDPIQDSKKVDMIENQANIVFVEKSIKAEIHNDNLNLSEVEDLKSEPTVNNYTTNTYNYPDYTPYVVNEYTASQNPYIYSLATTFYDYSDYSPYENSYVYDSYTYYDSYDYVVTEDIYDYPDYCFYI